MKMYTSNELQEVFTWLHKAAKDSVVQFMVSRDLKKVDMFADKKGRSPGDDGFDEDWYLNNRIWVSVPTEDLESRGECVIELKLTDDGQPMIVAECGHAFDYTEIGSITYIQLLDYLERRYSFPL